MQSFLVSTLLASSAVFSTAYAQVYNYPNVTDIDINVRNQWCTSQTSSCKLLCQNQELKVAANECFPDNLYYQCTCSNGLAPNATEYSQTIPFFICRLEVEDCQTACSGDATCISLCASGKQCGATDPTRVNATTTTSSTSKSSATGGSSATQTDSNGFAITGTSEASSGDASNGASTLLEAGSVYGMGVLVAGLAAGFALVGI
ncbi:hypothetical protein DFP73DRAFT_375877 [Morchella snyderi]|nr:hypothetical protein DFP73DRAFT_375877 [Morchella snyderi]